jgi:hypothetical protein
MVYLLEEAMLCLKNKEIMLDLCRLFSLEKSGFFERSGFIELSVEALTKNKIDFSSKIDLSKDDDSIYSDLKDMYFLLLEENLSRFNLVKFNKEQLKKQLSIALGKETEIKLEDDDTYLTNSKNFITGALLKLGYIIIGYDYDLMDSDYFIITYIESSQG